jgi:hypothetical protein
LHGHHTGAPDWSANNVEVQRKRVQFRRAGLPQAAIPSPKELRTRGFSHGPANPLELIYIKFVQRFIKEYSNKIAE